MSSGLFRRSAISMIMSRGTRATQLRCSFEGESLQSGVCCLMRETRMDIGRGDCQFFEETIAGQVLRERKRT